MISRNATLLVLAVMLVFATAAFAQTGHAEDPAHHDGTAAASGDQAVVADPHGEPVHGEAQGDAHGEGHGDPYHLVNFIGLISGGIAGSQPQTASFLNRFVDVIFSFLAMIIMVVFFARIYITRRSEDPGRLQVAIEMVFGGLHSLIESVIGPTARRYTPYLGTLFLFILVNNFMGLVPFFHASTSSINTTVALAICTFCYVQYLGITENGILGYLHHLCGSPRSGVEWGFVPLMLPLHIMGEFIKPLSLSLRLFGNIMGEDKLLAVFIVLGAALLGRLHVPFGIPIQVPIMFLAMLTSTIQALVFTLLSTVYIALMLPHGDHGEEAHGH